ncbi:MAG: SUMF1/EgtB/PvdO family nonheme iron enzyme [Alphaproteobacteria bacterium]|nr:SUMF1/EgtB/PvdO family nonheme iron enzyme [Alphaproteobacteria bacterium]
MAAASESQTVSDQLDVFISYSRHDMAFADRLVAALEARGFEVKIDRRDLPAFEEWKRELLGFICECDTVVFIVSPHSLGSAVVAWEVEQVRLHGKRLAPVVIADVQGPAAPPDIASLNYLFFTDEALFEQRCDELARALNTDLAWVKEHTRLGELARRWIERGRPDDALIRGRDIADAEEWARRPARTGPAVTEAQREFLIASRAAQRRQAKRRRQVQAVLGFIILASLGYAAWSNRAYLEAHLARGVELLRPTILTAAAERALKPGDSFKECRGCLEMVVVPAGNFMMGSPPDEQGRQDSEDKEHPVAIGAPFAVSRFEVTFAEWDACTALGGCPYQPADEGWKGDRQPVINVNWNDAKLYAAWVSGETGQPYRLLSEAEWEFAARGGTATPYSWGAEIGDNKADCRRCGSPWDYRQPAPVGSFAANAFGLYDMHGNVWEWVEDCWHANYDGAPRDGSAWTSACADAASHVVRSGAWNDLPADLRAAARYRGPTEARNAVNGIRLARTLRQ